jgi:hypothetical protein
MSSYANMDTRTLRNRLLNKTVARRMISKLKCMVELGKLDAWVCNEKFTKVSLSGFKKLEKDGETGSKNTPIEKYMMRGPAIDGISLYHFVLDNGNTPIIEADTAGEGSYEQVDARSCVPVFTGGAMHPTWPLSDSYARSMLIVHKPWRMVADLRVDENIPWTTVRPCLHYRP